MKANKHLGMMLFFVGIVIAIIASTLVLKVPVFADGVQHVWITEYMVRTGHLPTQDITGIQPANFSVPISIQNSEPFVNQPVFYYLTTGLALVSGSSLLAVETIGIVSMVGAAVFIYLLLKILRNKRTALIGFFLVITSNIWPWLIVHRIIEPIILVESAALLYFLQKYFSGKKAYLFPILLTVVFLFGTKLSTLPILLTLFIVLMARRTWKELIVFTCGFIILLSPILYQSIKVNHSPTPTPTGISKLDRKFKNAWWNQPLQNWEIHLNKDSDSKNLRKKTLEQFKHVQSSPANLYRSSGTTGLISEFSINPVSQKNSEGYQSVISNKIAPIASIILILSIPALLASRELIKKNAWIYLYLLLLLGVTVAFWYKQPVFRYYLFIIFISVILLSISVDFILEKIPHQYKWFFVTFLLLLSTMNLKSEINRDLLYSHTAMHRQIPTSGGGLKDSISFGNKIKEEKSSKQYIFTPMVEIAYYSQKKYMWDNRLFFVNDESKLNVYLKHYDFQYVVLPFFSGSTTNVSWHYYDGIPSNSTFYKLLNDPKKFKLVESNNTFSAYKKVST